MDYNITPTEYSKSSFGGSEALKSQMFSNNTIRHLELYKYTWLSDVDFKYSLCLQSWSCLFPEARLTQNILREVIIQSWDILWILRIYCVWFRAQGWSIHQAVVEKVVLRQSPYTECHKLKPYPTNILLYTSSQMVQMFSRFSRRDF